MECPFCAETIKDEAIACKFCTRDLLVVRPVIADIQTAIADIERLHHELNAAKRRLAFATAPARFLADCIGRYVVLPTALLLIAHYLILFRFDVSELYLRIFSVLIPLPFGLALFVRHRIGARWAFAAGTATALISIFGMLCVVASIDNVPVFPTSARDWRETIEYAVSIALAYGSGNILGLAMSRLIPTRTISSGQPSRIALYIARLFGRDIGPDALRRRARRIQEFLRALAPLTGLLISGGASLYTGLKNLLGH